MTDLELQMVSQLSLLHESDLWIHAVVIWMCGRTLLSSDIAATSAMISPSCTLAPITQWLCGTVWPYMLCSVFPLSVMLCFTYIDFPRKSLWM